jgi:hypothetical protein
MKTLQEICEAIKDKTTGNWEYDDRFSSALTVIKNDDAVSLMDTLTVLFEAKYDHKTIKKSDKITRKLAKEFSGMQNGQFLFTSYNGTDCLFAAWWPWGDNTRVSLRVGFYNTSNNENSTKANFGV